MEPNRHDHISGRTRRYISHKWFHRGRHRPGAARTSVEELVAELEQRTPKTNWRLSVDGKYWTVDTVVHLYGDQTAIVMMPLSSGLTSIPVLGK